MFAIAEAARGPRAHARRSSCRRAREALGAHPRPEGPRLRPVEHDGQRRERGEFEVEIRGNLELAELDEISRPRSSRSSQTRGGFVDLDKSLKLGLPEVRVVPDREKAAALGVDARTLATTIQAMIGGLDVGDLQGGRAAATTSACASRTRTAHDPDAIEQPLRAHARRRAWSSCATW